MVLVIEINGDMENKQDESYKKKNSAKSNYAAMNFSITLNGQKLRN